MKKNNNLKTKLSLILLAVIGLSNSTFAINAPLLLTPPDGSTGWYSIRSIQCYIVDGITDVNKYTFEMDTTPNFNSSMYMVSNGTDYYSSSGGYIRKANDQGLKYGATYYWRVNVTNGTETSVWSEVRSFTVLSKITLYSPSDNSTNLFTGVSISCNIEDYNTDYNNYEFEMDTTPNFNSSLHTISDGNGYNSSYDYIYKSNSDLLYGTKYYWRARVRNTNYTSEWSDTRNFTTLDQLTLYSPSDNSTNLFTGVSISCNIEDYNTYYNNYEFEMDTTPNFNSSLYTISNGNGYNSSYDYIYKSNSDLLYGTKYYWRARVRNANDTSQWSATRNFTTLDQLTLYSPSDNSTNIFTSVGIKCNIEDYNTDYNNYEFEMDTTPNFNSSLYEISHGTSYSSSYDYINKSNSDLLYGTKYYWRARVRNANDTSQWSDTRNFTTLDQLTLYSPSDNSTNIFTSVGIKCNIEDYNTDYNNYEFEMDTTPNFNSSLYEISHGTSYSSSYDYINKSNSDLLYGTKYYWRARVRNANDTSQWSTIRNFTTLDQLTLYSPSDNSTNLSIDISIKCNIENYHTAYSDYDFQLDTTINFNSPILIFTEGNGYNSSYDYIYKTNSNLRYGQDYYWRARVRNASDTTQWSVVRTFKTAYEMANAPALTAPTDNSIDISYNSFLIDWESVVDANTYQYQISTVNDFTNIIKTGNTSLTDRTITNLNPNTIYYWRIRAENANGYSPWSTIWQFTTEHAILSEPILISPANNSIGIDFNSVTLDWNSVFGASDYTYEISTDNTFTAGVTTETISETDKNLIGLDINTQYFWRVKSSDDYSESAWSAVWNFTTNNNVGISSLSNSSSINIFPNPASKVINIRFYINSHEVMVLNIYNVMGTLIKTEILEQNQQQINIDNLTNGIYMIEIKSKEWTEKRKLIIQK